MEIYLQNVYHILNQELCMERNSVIYLLCRRKGILPGGVPTNQLVSNFLFQVVGVILLLSADLGKELGEYSAIQPTPQSIHFLWGTLIWK